MLERDTAIALIDALAQRGIGTKVTVSTYAPLPEGSGEDPVWTVRPDRRWDRCDFDAVDLLGVIAELGLNCWYSPGSGFTIDELPRSRGSIDKQAGGE